MPVRLAYIKPKLTKRVLFIQAAKAHRYYYKSFATTMVPNRTNKSMPGLGTLDDLKNELDDCDCLRASPQSWTSCQSGYLLNMRVNPHSGPYKHAGLLGLRPLSLG